MIYIDYSENDSYRCPVLNCLAKNPFKSRDTFQKHFSKVHFILCGFLKEANQPTSHPLPEPTNVQPPSDPSDQRPQPVAADTLQDPPREDNGMDFDPHDYETCDYESFKRRTAQLMVNLKSRHKVSSGACNDIVADTLRFVHEMYQENPVHFRANVENSQKIVSSTFLQRRFTNALPLKIIRHIDTQTKKPTKPDIYYIPIADTLKRVLSQPGVMDIIKSDHARKTKL